jgi:hypothetical protein
MPSRASMLPPKNSPARKTALALLACVMSCMAGCFATKVVRDPSVPHRLARPVEAYEWRRLPNGQLAECPVTIPAGDWIVPDSMITIPPAETK